MGTDKDGSSWSARARIIITSTEPGAYATISAGPRSDNHTPTSSANPAATVMPIANEPNAKPAQQSIEIATSGWIADCRL
jgi:hypothetical protein